MNLMYNKWLCVNKSVIVLNIPTRGIELHMETPNKSIVDRALDKLKEPVIETREDFVPTDSPARPPRGHYIAMSRAHAQDTSNNLLGKIQR